MPSVCNVQQEVINFCVHACVGIVGFLIRFNFCLTRKMVPITRPASSCLALALSFLLYSPAFFHLYLLNIYLNYKLLSN